MNKTTRTCCLCGKTIYCNEHYWGNNPEPLMPNVDANGELQVCCDECNAEVVIPARLSGQYNW